MAVSVEPGVGSKWQGLALQEQAKQGVHPRVEPDPLLDLAELEVRIYSSTMPTQFLFKSDIIVESHAEFNNLAYIVSPQISCGTLVFIYFKFVMFFG